MILQLLHLSFTAFMVYLYVRNQKNLRNKEAMLAKVSLDYVKANRQGKEFQLKYDKLLTIHAKEVGFTK